MMLVEETAPPQEALPVAGLRGQLRLGTGFDLAEDAAEEAALAGFLRAAIATVEARTGKVLLRRPFRMRIEGWRDASAQPLPLAPVQSVDAMQIEDGRGGVTEIEPARWRLVADPQRPLLVPVGGLLPYVPRNGFVTIRFTAGFAEDWAGVPADLAQAVLMLAARHYEDRGGDSARQALPFGVAALLERWRAVRLLAGRGRGRG